MQFVIGDIHGEITKVKELIKNIYKIDNQAQLIFLGDYINKGENSKAVLDYLITLENSIYLIGNHEYYFLQYLKNGTYADKLQKYAASSTFIDFDMNLSNINEKLYLPYKDFFDNLESYYETEEFFISHAGIDVEFIENNFDTLSQEKFFLFNRYSFITYSKKIRKKIALFGHTGFTYPYYDGIKIGIDTAAVYAAENPLTAFCLDTKMFVNDKNQCTFLKDMKLNSCPNIIRKEPYRLEK